MAQEQAHEIITIRVKHGDTLSEIASRYNVNIDDLQQWNRIENSDLIQVDQKIIVHAAPDSPPDIWITGVIILVLTLFWLLGRRKTNDGAPIVRQETFPQHNLSNIIAGIPNIEQPIADNFVRPVSASHPKGDDGEKLVNTWLTKQYPEWVLFDNVLIPSGQGTTQIDHILISPWVIFLIETKNMEGWIFGSPGRKQWTQSFATNRRSHLTKTKSKQFKFYNPLLQNEGHSKSFIKLDILNYSWIRPIVLFTGNAKLKTKSESLPYEEHEKIAYQNRTWRMRGVVCMNLENLSDYISFSVRKSSNPPLTRQKMEVISSKIKMNEIPLTIEAQERHTKFVKSIRSLDE